MPAPVLPRALLCALALAAAGAPARAHADACQGLVPEALARQLARHYPGLRTPLEYDNAPADIEAAQARGGSACLGVLVADLGGEGKNDIVVGLTARKGNGGLALVARPQRGGWRLQELETWPEHSRASKAIGAIAPGRYGTLECPSGGLRIETIGAGATLYCLAQGQWRHAPAP
jgi:hypothetical protein